MADGLSVLLFESARALVHGFSGLQEGAARCKGCYHGFFVGDVAITA